MDPDRPIEAWAALSDAIRADATRYRAGARIEQVRARLTARRSVLSMNRWRLAAIPLTLAIVAGGVGLARPADHAPARPAAADVPPDVTSASTQPTPIGTGPAPVAGPIGLASCDIAPADAGLAFAGWATRDVLGVSGGAVGSGEPVYALITSGLAEWVGWQADHSGPMYPPPIGRMGCLYDPASRTSSIVGVPIDWQPPALVDGCLASATDSYGGYQEVGGPGAWLVLPTDRSGWHAGASIPLLFRLGSSADSADRVGGWAQAIGPDRRQIAGAGGGSAAAARVTGSSATYYAMRFRFPHAGCWAVNLTLDGMVVGSAVIAVEAATG